MESFLIVNPKGGAGKTTLATNLAACLAHAGGRVMLGDVDRQQSARQWLAIRPASLPHISSWEMSADGPARPPRDTTHVVLDTPAGLHGKKLETLLKRVNRIIVPLQPSLFDILATRSFLEVLLADRAVRSQRARVAIVGMRVDARTRAAQELERFLAGYELPVLTYLRDTQLYVQAAAHGLTLFDLPASRMQRDLEQWAAIAEWVRLPGGHRQGQPQGDQRG